MRLTVVIFNINDTVPILSDVLLDLEIKALEHRTFLGSSLLRDLLGNRLSKTISLTFPDTFRSLDIVQ